MRPFYFPSLTSLVILSSFLVILTGFNVPAADAAVSFVAGLDRERPDAGTLLGASALPDTSEAWRSPTLRGWHTDIRTAVRDRRHAYGGLFFDRGVFRRLTPAMDHEYDVDLLTYGFTPSDDAVWYGSDHGVRSFMGSIHKSRFATQTRFRHRILLADRQSVMLDAMQQEDLTAQRFFIEFGYAYRLTKRHRIGFSQTVAAYKPDLDFTVFYTYETPDIGSLRGELALLDAANNVIFDRLGVDPVLEDTVRSYHRKPRLVDLSWRSPSLGGFRSEVTAGIQPVSRSTVQTQQTDDVHFRWNERLDYLGILFEYRHALLTSGVIFRRTSSRVSRHSEAGARDETAMSASQVTNAATLYLLVPVWVLRTQLWLTAEGYTDDQAGTAFEGSSIAREMSYLERRRTLHARVAYTPQRGLRAGLDYFVDHRTFVRGSEVMNAYLRFLPWSPNGRLALSIGYQFAESAYLVVGGAYDVGGDPFYEDGRGSVRYDGGFGRMVVSW